MNDRGGIDPNVSGRCKARPRATLRDRRLDLRLRQAAEPVRSRRDQQRGIVRRHVVEMDPQRQHRLDHGEGRLDML
jgi:hypothetical protein